MTNEKLVEKLAKMKAHMESARAIGSEAEAQAFSDKLQELLQRHKLQMTDIEFADLEKSEPIGEHPVDMSKIDSKRASRERVGWIERLAVVVAKAHFCRITLHPMFTSICFIGRKHDCEIAEYVFVTLQAAAKRIALAAEAEFRVEVRKGGKRGEIRGFKDSFISGFLARLHSRFEELRNSAAASSSMALVRLNKAESDVAEYMRQNYTKSIKMSRMSTGNSEGYVRGAMAADKVSITGNAMPGGGRSKQLR